MPETVPEAGPMAVRFAQFTMVGDRRSNQDVLGHAEQDGLACFVVSDGVGGQEGGAIAAEIVVRSILERFRQESSFTPRALRSYLDYAIAQVAQRRKEDTQLQNMSTTVAALLIDQNNRCALWAHLGDTRIYLFRGNKVQSVTRDHSLVQQFADAGYCTADEMRTHPQRNALYAAIGQEGGMAPEVTQEMVDIQVGDAFLVCSDGLWECLTDKQIEEALAASHSAEEWLNHMCDAIDVMDKTSGLTTVPAPKSRDNCTAFTIVLSLADAANPQLAAIANFGR